MKIYIDIGHGKRGEDSGATAVSGGVTYTESKQNYKIAEALIGALSAKGHTLTASRADDQNIGSLVGTYSRADSNLINSASKAKTGDYDLVLSIHCNDSTNTKAQGFWYCYKTGNNKEETSKAWANKIATSCEKAGFNTFWLGEKIGNSGNDYYGILRLHDKPAVLIECGFMSNATDLHNILCNYAAIGVAIAGAFDTVTPTAKEPETTDREAIKAQIIELLNKL